MPGPVRVFVACSLDGFIAGPDDDLSWLPSSPEGEDFGYGAFMADTAALLMGRNTYEVVAGFDAWPYGETLVFVATSRPLEATVETVHPIGGDPAALLAAVRAHSDGGIYLDGGALIRAFLDAGLVDELTVSVIPIVLGAGAPLFAGTARRHALEFLDVTPHAGGLVQLRYRPTERTA